MSYLLRLAGSLLAVLPLGFMGYAQQKPTIERAPVVPTNPSSGSEMYRAHCAVCHGLDGKGNGPAASAMKSQPTDLTQLARKHDGKFPANSVASALKFGSGSGAGAHGSAQMPVWGPLFQSLDKFNDTVVQQRVSNLINYIETLQAK